MAQQTTSEPQPRTDPHHYKRNRIIAGAVLATVVSLGVWIANSPPDKTDAEIAYLAAVFDLHHTFGADAEQLIAAGHHVCTDMVTFNDNDALAKFRLMNAYGTDLTQTNLVFNAATTTLCPAASVGGALPGSVVDPNR